MVCVYSQTSFQPIVVLLTLESVCRSVVSDCNPGEVGSRISGRYFTIWAPGKPPHVLNAWGGIMFGSPAAAAAAASLQSCPTLCDPINGSPPGSSIPGILQARTLEWAAISFSSARKWKVKVKSLSRARLLAIPCPAASQAPPPMGFSRQEYWSGVPLPSPMFGSRKSKITG